MAKIDLIKKDIDILSKQFRESEEEKAILLMDEKVRRYESINAEIYKLTRLLKEKRFELELLQMSECEHIFFKSYNKDHSWNFCIKCGVTNKYKILKGDNMTFEEIQITNTYKTTARNGIFMENDDNFPHLYLKDIYNDIINRYPNIELEQIAAILKEELMINKTR